MWTAASDMTEQNVDELFARTLSGDYGDAAPQEAVSALRMIGTRQVFDIAASWCRSESPLKRARGAAVLGQLGKTWEHRTNSFPDESYSAVTDLLARETEPQPLASAIVALGHLDNPAAVPLIAPYQGHADPRVRFGVAFALGCFPDEPESARTLLQLMEDSDEDVRDWATFGLGVQGDSDSEEIRKALLRNVEDADEDVSEEAMCGLAKRKDVRVLPKLLHALEPPSVSVRVIEAAYEMLGMDSERGEWGSRDYAEALRRQYGEQIA